MLKKRMNLIVDYTGGFSFGKHSTSNIVEQVMAKNGRYVGCLGEDYSSPALDVSEEAPIDGKNAPENLKQARLATVLHRVGKRMLDDIASMEFGDEDSTLIILSGIQINMPRPFQDYFQPLAFEVRGKDGQKIDLMEDCFSDDKPIPRGSVHYGDSLRGSSLFGDSLRDEQAFRTSF